MGPAQPVAMRAPEVYEGRGCSHASDIWSFAVTMFDWIKPGVFGAAGNVYGVPWESWCIAKLMLLFPSWNDQASSDDEYMKDIFKLGHLLIGSPIKDNPNEKIVLVSSLEDEMQTMNIPPELKDLFRYLFVLDSKQRPSATQALASDQFQALKQAALGSTSVRT